MKDTLMTKCGANHISSMCEITKVFSILRKIKYFPFFSTTNRFLVLPLKTVRKSQATIPITILRYDLDHTCSSEILNKIKGRTSDWMHRWHRGDICYVAYVDGEPIAHLWVRHGEWHLRGKDKGSPLPPPSAFIYDSRVLEEWRGKKVFQAMLSKAAVDVSSRSYDYLYGLVNERNIASWSGFTRVGFRRTEHYIRLYRFLKVFNYRRDVVSLLDGC